MWRRFSAVPLSMCVSSFNLLGLTVLEKSVTKKFVWKLERKKNEEIKGQICSSSLILVYTIHSPTVDVCTKFQYAAAAWFRYTRYTYPLSMCVPSFNFLGLTVPEKNVMKKFNVWKLERKKNEEIKGRISISSLTFVYTKHSPTVNVCTKFQLCRPYSSWEKCDDNFC